MNKADKIVLFLDRHKYGILITLFLHIGLFIYLQVTTYKEGVLYEPWNFREMNAEAPDNIEITAEQIQTEAEQNIYQEKEVTSFVKNENDSRNRSNDAMQSYTSYSNYKNVEKMEDDYEKSIKDRIAKEKEAKEQNKQNSATSDVENKKEDKGVDKDKFNFGQNSSSEAVSGETMVSYSLKDRYPLNHNDWYIRNPGYTCGNVNGTVKVAIIVDKGGKVISATYMEVGSQNASECMRQKAVEYALKSRFNYSGQASDKQEGIITYRFVFRN